MKKALILSTLTASLLLSGLSYAKDDSRQDCHDGDRPPAHHDMGGIGDMRGMRERDGMSPEEMMQRQFTPEQIRVLLQARLIMRGNDNIKVGSISATDGGYKATIVTQDNSLVETLELAKNGMPKAMFERMQARQKAFTGRAEK